MQDAADRTPVHVALFSGHMIDAPDRETPRFPPDKEGIAAKAIAGALDELGLQPGDLAICGGACGGDLLFAEAALARSARVALYLPFDEEHFLSESVDFAGPGWRARYFAVKARASVHVIPAERGPARDGEDPYVRNNLWMLEAASRFGAGRLAVVCLWNGERGDGPGGAQHMMEAVRGKGGRAIWLDTRKLWTA
jgi:hypothetical protein